MNSEQKTGESGDCAELIAQAAPGELAEGEALVDELHNVLGGGSREEYFGDAGLLERRNVGFGNDAADKDGNVGHAFVAEEFHQLGADGVMRAGEDREADHVDVFLDGGGGDHLWSLAQAGVHDFHAGVAQGPGDYFCAAVVAIEARLGNQHTNLLLHHKPFTPRLGIRKTRPVSWS